MLSQIPVLILAGGLGTRLKPVLQDRPKGLAPIGTDFFLEIQIRLLRRQGAQRFVLCVGYLAEQIQSALGSGQSLGVQIEYSVEPVDHLLGTAGALKKAERYFAPHALVLNGDTYFDIDYAAFLLHHLEAKQRQNAIATLALTRLSKSERYGNVILDPSGQAIRAFREKDAEGASGWVSGGVYAIDRALLDYVPGDQPCSIEREVFPRVLSDGHVLAAMTCTDRFFDIGTPDAWKQFVTYYSGLQSGKSPNPDPTVER